MGALRTLAESPAEWRWFAAADLVAALGRWHILPRRLWYPLWCACYRRGAPREPASAEPDEPARVAIVDPPLAERAVGEPLA